MSRDFVYTSINILLQFNYLIFIFPSIISISPAIQLFLLFSCFCYSVVFYYFLFNSIVSGYSDTSNTLDMNHFEKTNDGYGVY
jgi:hypothetical protein